VAQPALATCRWLQLATRSSWAKVAPFPPFGGSISSISSEPTSSLAGEIDSLSSFIASFLAARPS